MLFVSLAKFFKPKKDVYVECEAKFIDKSTCRPISKTSWAKCALHFLKICYYFSDTEAFETCFRFVYGCEFLIWCDPTWQAALSVPVTSQSPPTARLLLHWSTTHAENNRSQYNVALPYKMSYSKGGSNKPWTSESGAVPWDWRWIRKCWLLLRWSVSLSNSFSVALC